ncbi:hypothetical protein [Lapidilactobacillus luobeiensis]|uniref:hypothetical protein n=1 Tax=Lapidilactobacillus luobeiensis TaxID=2950371 RepID=UPI0021C49006|nr:hypothetical protein [Lapidilactobacillus luobeiensis]
MPDQEQNKKKIHIRPYQDTDEPAVLAMIRRTILEIKVTDYTLSAAARLGQLF